MQFYRTEVALIIPDWYSNRFASWIVLTALLFTLTFAHLMVGQVECPTGDLGGPGCWRRNVIHLLQNHQAFRTLQTCSRARVTEPSQITGTYSA